MIYRTLRQAEENIRWLIGVEEAAIKGAEADGGTTSYLRGALDRDRARLAHIERYKSMGQSPPCKPPSPFKQYAIVIGDPVLGGSYEATRAKYEKLRDSGFTYAIEGYGHELFNPDSAARQMLLVGGFPFILWAVDKNNRGLWYLHNGFVKDAGEPLSDGLDVSAKVAFLSKGFVNHVAKDQLEFHYPPRREWYPIWHPDRGGNFTDENEAIERLNKIYEGLREVSVDEFLHATAKPGREVELRGEIVKLTPDLFYNRSSTET